MEEVHDKIIYKDLSYKIIGLLFETYNHLGYGYKEKHYELAFEKCLISSKILYQRQLPCNLLFQGETIGKYYLDFLIENRIIVELKKGNHFSRNNINQVKEYLHNTGKKLAILANFTPTEVRYIRVVNIN